MKILKIVLFKIKDGLGLFLCTYSEKQKGKYKKISPLKVQ